MNEFQKKIIKNTFLIIFIIFSLACSGLWLYSIITDLMLNQELTWQVIVKETMVWLFTNFGSMILGIIIKLYINKRHRDRLHQELDNRGVKPLQINQINSNGTKPSKKDKSLSNDAKNASQQEIPKKTFSGY